MIKKKIKNGEYNRGHVWMLDLITILGFSNYFWICIKVHVFADPIILLSLQ